MKNFTQIPNEFINEKNLSDSEFRTLVLLMSYKYGNNKVFPSLKTLADARNKSIKSITIHLKGLKNKKYLISKRRGFSDSNEYEFTTEENFTNDASQFELNYQSVLKKTSLINERNLQPNNNLINKTENNNTDFEKCEKIIEETRKKYPFLWKNKSN